MLSHASACYLFGVEAFVGSKCFPECIEFRDTNHDSCMDRRPEIDFRHAAPAHMKALSLKTFSRSPPHSQDGA